MRVLVACRFWAHGRLRGDVAQLGERLVRNEEGGGSIPLISKFPEGYLSWEPCWAGS